MNVYDLQDYHIPKHRIFFYFYNTQRAKTWFLPQYKIDDV